MTTYTLSDEKLQKKINWSPYSPLVHKPEIKVLRAFDKKRDIRISSGVRLGKSAICAYLGLREFLKDNKRIWIVAPTYDLTERVFEYVTVWISRGFPSLAPQIAYRPIPQIIAPWGSFIKCKSGENKKGLLGEELDLAIIDEAALMDEEGWNLVYDRLTTRKGKSVHISNPWGQNWWWRECLRADSAKDGAFFTFESRDNPYFPKSEWKRAQERLDEDTFNQKYRAMFLSTAATLFRNIENCITGKKEPYRENHLYVIGVDWAKMRDFTVFVVLDRMTHHVVYLDRFKGVNYSLQMDRLAALSQDYHDPEIWMDTTGLGEVISDVLRTRGEGLNIQDFRFTGKSKEALFHKSSIWTEKKRVTFPNIPILINELRVFGKEMTPAGNITYSAPAGFNDDSCTAYSLAIWPLDEEPWPELVKGQTQIHPFPIAVY